MNCVLRKIHSSFPIIATIAFLTAAVPMSYGQVIEQAVLDSVVQIKNPAGTGSGFLVRIPADSSKHRKNQIFLITNKHMLGCWTPLDTKMTKLHDLITLRLYLMKPDSSAPVMDIPVKLLNSDGSLNTSRVALHPDPLVDVAVVRLENQDISPPDSAVWIQALQRAYFKPFHSLRDGLTETGDVVFALGYPQGMATDRAVAKAGYLASAPGEEVVLSVPSKTCDGKRESSVVLSGKLFLVDGLIFPGSSGGPVLLPAGGSFGHDSGTGQFQSNRTRSNRIIGIVSGKLAASGVSIAYSSDYVDELIDGVLKRNHTGQGK